MHRLLVLYPPPADPQAFRDYYEANHLPLAARLPGLRGYRWGFDVTALGADSPYFCVFQADFDDAAALDAALGSPEGEATAADVPNYATGRRSAPALRRPRGPAAYAGSLSSREAPMAPPRSPSAATWTSGGSPSTKRWGIIASRMRLA